MPYQARLSVWGADGLTTGGTATLTCDQYPDQTFVGTIDGPRWLFTLPADAKPWGAWLDITGVAGYQTYRGRCVVAPDLADVALDPAIVRVMVQGRQFRTVAGARFRWRGISGFRLLEWIATGHQDAAEAFLDWALSQGCTVVRVFSMCRYMFPLDPAQGRAALPQALELAAQRGLYLEVVGLADTASYPTLDMRAHVYELGTICAQYDNSFLEVANEPIHSTQLPVVGDPAFLQQLADTVPASVPVALGAAHGGNDESRAFIGGDYVTVHGDRDASENGWRPVRHTNEQRALSEDIDKPVVNDEPSRELTPDKHLGLALICVMHGGGDTFHYAAGRDALPATGLDADCLAQRRRGWDAVPEDWWGAYKNAGWAGSPVRSFTGALRCYSSVSGDRGYTLGLDCSDATRVEWADGWVPQLLIAEGGVRWWAVRRV